jgi:hypothetical protein
MHAQGGLGVARIIADNLINLGRVIAAQPGT